MAAFGLFSNRNTGQKCRAIKIDTGTAPILTIDDPRLTDGSVNPDPLYEWDGHKFEGNSGEAPKNGGYIVAYDDSANHYVSEIDFRDNWHDSGDTAQTGSSGAVTNEPASTGSGGTGTQE